MDSSQYGMETYMFCLSMAWRRICSVSVWHGDVYALSQYGVETYMLCLSMAWRRICSVSVWRGDVYALELPRMYKVYQVSPWFQICLETFLVSILKKG